MGGRETGNIGSMVREEETGAREEAQRSSQELNFMFLYCRCPWESNPQPKDWLFQSYFLNIERHLIILPSTTTTKK